MPVGALQVQSLMTNGERYNLSAAVFTALTDVECEIDGLLSYDRVVIKMGAQALHQIHSELIQSSLALNHQPVGEALLTSWQALRAAVLRDALSAVAELKQGRNGLLAIPFI